MCGGGLSVLSEFIDESVDKKNHFGPLSCFFCGEVSALCGVQILLPAEVPLGQTQNPVELQGADSLILNWMHSSSPVTLS